MKGFVLSLISCVIFFVAFGISVSILGVNTDAVNVSYYESPDYSNGTASILSGNTIKSEEWKINGNFSKIKLDTSGINTVVTSSERDNIYISLYNSGKRNIRVDAYGERTSDAEADALTLNVSPADFLWSVNWIGDLISGRYVNVELIIELPAKIYEKMEIYQGSGRISIKDVYAKNNVMEIGSGVFSLEHTDNTTLADSYELSLGSGSATVIGMNTQRYKFDIGSGVFNIEKLTGSGEIDMGSGNGSVIFEEYNGDCGVDMGSGHLTLYIPEKASVNIKSDIGSGGVYVDACGVNKDIRSRNDYEAVTIGGGEHKLNIDMGSGSINIFDNKQYYGTDTGETAFSSTFIEYKDLMPEEAGSIIGEIPPSGGIIYVAE